MEAIIKPVITILMLTLAIITAINTSIAAVRKNKESPLTHVLLEIPEFIDIAEHMGFKDGKAKKDYVLNLCYTRLKTELKANYDDVVKEYKDTLSNYIEKVGKAAHFKQKGE